MLGTTAIRRFVRNVITEVGTGTMEAKWEFKLGKCTQQQQQQQQIDHL